MEKKKAADAKELERQKQELEKQQKKELEKKQKQDQLEAQVTQEFAAKKSGTAPGGDALKHLALWLDNPPFKSNNVQLKRETFLAILNFIGQLKPDQVDKQLNTALDIKQGITLSKYIFKAFEVIDKGDKCKLSISLIFLCLEALNAVPQQTLLKVQLKVQEKYGQCAILKAAFEKHPILDAAHE